MYTICHTPTRIYNSSDKKQRKHKYAINKPVPQTEPRCKKYQVIETVKLENMRDRIAKYERAEKKIRLLSSWGLRSTKSSLGVLRGILETLDDLYGDDAFDKEE